MPDLGRQNDAWRGRVIAMMREGCGFEDIAVRLSCDPEDVRREAEILRGEGRLIEIYRTWRRK